MTSISPAPGPVPPRSCIYTAMIGSHEGLNEQPIVNSSGLPFICFTDDPELRSETWQIRLVKPFLGRDPSRSQREIKLRPHKYLTEFDASLYIDNTVVLKARPEEIFNRYFPGSGLALAQHSFRQFVADEFIAVCDERKDQEAPIIEQMNHYALTNPKVLEERPYWGAILLRDHRIRPVRDAMELWFAHILRYSKRDQLSLNFVLREIGLTPNVIAVDNFASWFHEWPKRMHQIAGWDRLSHLSYLGPLMVRNRVLELELSKLASKNDDVVKLRRLVEDLQGVARNVPALKQIIAQLRQELYDAHRRIERLSAAASPASAGGRSEGEQ